MLPWYQPCVIASPGPSRLPSTLPIEKVRLAASAALISLAFAEAVGLGGVGIEVEYAVGRRDDAHETGVALDGVAVHHSPLVAPFHR